MDAKRLLACGALLCFALTLFAQESPAENNAEENAALTITADTDADTDAATATDTDAAVDTATDASSQPAENTAPDTSTANETATAPDEAAIATPDETATAMDAVPDETDAARPTISPANDDTEYHIEEGRFLQTLSWTGQNNALYYVLEIEKEEEAVWQEYLKEQSDSAAVEVSLPSGNYRYRITAYDFLRRAGPVSEWIGFEVFYAWQPELQSFSPGGFYLDEDRQWEITINGENFVEGCEIYLRSGLRNIMPVSITINARRNSARLVFKEMELDTGSFEIYVINPGGLDAHLGNFRIAFRKAIDLNLSIGYMPLIPLYGAVNEVWEQEFLPMGFYARAGVSFFKRRWGYLGVELEPYWNSIQIKTDYYTESAHLFGAAVYALYQKWLPNKTMAINVRVGFGLYGLLDYHFEYTKGGTEPIAVLLPSINAGASFQWLAIKPFFAEAGINYIHFIGFDAPQPGYLMPFIGMGFQL
jgi:hypothetical protein